jgi:DtxR family Mn-dependent transcriptional regulator
MTTDSMEEYLETICKLSSEQSPVALSALADQMRISSVSANEMIKKLMARDLVTYEPYKGVTLTAEGQPTCWVCPGIESTRKPVNWNTPPQC